MFKIKNYQLYYLISFFNFFILEITGTSLILFILDKGYSLQKANLFMLVMFFLGLLLEIPTGIVADKLGRKFSTLAGLWIYVLYSFLFTYFHNFIILLLTQVLGSLALCLISGSMEAWIAENSEKNIETVFSTSNSIQYVAGIFCGIIGAYLASVSYVLPWIVSMIINIVLILFITVSVKEGRRTNSFDIEKKNSLLDFIKESYQFIRKNKYFLPLFFFVFFIGMSNSSANTFQQPRLVGLSGQGVWIMGYIKSGYSLFMVLGSVLVKKLTKKNSHIKILRLTCLMLGVWLILSGIFDSFYLVLLSFFMYEIGRGMYNPVIQIYTNSLVGDSNRATMLSVQSTFNQLGMCLGLLITGVISKNFIGIESDQTPIKISWIICGAFALIPLLFMKSKRSKE